jgi:hypothetical protein
MSLIDEHDKKNHRDQVLFCKEVKDFADRLLMKMQLGMGRMSSFKEMFGFFHGHIDVFQKSFLSGDEEDPNAARNSRTEWLAELNFKFAELTSLFSSVTQFPPQEHPGRYYYFASEQYLALNEIDSSSNCLEKFIPALERAIKFFEAYQQTRHLRLCKFQLRKYANKLEAEKPESFEFSWPSLRCQYLEIAIKQQTNQKELLEQVWELANICPEKFAHQLSEQISKMKNIEPCELLLKRFSGSSLIKCHIRYIYTRLEAGKPISIYLRIHNNIPNFVLSISSIKVLYKGAKTHHSVSKDRFEVKGFHLSNWEVIVQKSTVFGVEKIYLQLAESPITLIIDKENLFVN